MKQGLLLCKEDSFQDGTIDHIGDEYKFHVFFIRNILHKNGVKSYLSSLVLQIFHNNIYILEDDFLHNYNYNSGTSK